ncbi:MAG: DNA gyrase/topoisomerase IV subunit A [Candidatus Nanopelagicales bacterium]
MARRTPEDNTPVLERIDDIDVTDEMQGSFLEYAYSVIYSRALPDARDGLKPVQRRILFTMNEMGLRPDRGHVKSARVVGEVMGRLHPHGDTAIYDTMVRMAQNFSLRLPMIDGHGNFGSLDDGAAAYRYTEARLAAAALLMTTGLEEDVVDFAPNYDGRETEPTVLPAALPHLLVNGASGIAVGMATNMPPHNLVEVIAATRHLLSNPRATLADLMRFVPGPDLPTGGRIIGIDGIRDAYREGRGAFKMRATVKIEHVTARRQALVVTELPYNVGPERVIERIKDLVQSKKLQGISDVTDLSDGERGLRLIIEIKSGFNPEAVLEQLYRSTPLEEQFTINNVALVNGKPETLGLREMLDVYIAHRIEVVTRRSRFRRAKAADRLHLVDGVHIAILNIDEVIDVIRTSDDASAARARLMQVFELSEIQATFILEMPLRRLTKFSTLELEKEREELQRSIAELDALLADERLIRRTVSDELAEVASVHGTPRRTVLLEQAPEPVTTDLEVADEPCFVLLASTGLVARTRTAAPLSRTGGRARHDVIVGAVLTSTRGEFGVVTNRGRLARVSAVALPVLADTATSPVLRGGVPIADTATFDKGETIVAIVDVSESAAPIALGTRKGVVKRVAPELVNKPLYEIVSLADGDEIIGAGNASDGDELAFISDQAQLLHFPASAVRPQGRAAAGMAGINLDADANVIRFSVVPAAAEVITVAASRSALPGADPGTIKRTPFTLYPGKGRATGGVRCHGFRKGEDHLAFAAITPAEPRLAGPSGAPVDAPELSERRDGTGAPLQDVVEAAG